MILSNKPENIKIAAEAILEGDIVAFPTETVYGLGADGLNPKAVAKIFEAKERPSFNPLIMHVSSTEQLEELVYIENKVVYKLIEKFWPGPLTLVLPKRPIVPDIVTAGNETVAVRMPRHPVAIELLKSVNKPISAPSANKFGFLSPTTAEHVEKQLQDKVDIILNGGQSVVGVESTILEITEDSVFLLRHGGISIDELKKICSSIEEKEADPQNPNAPGQLLHHYAPKIPIKFIAEAKEEELLWKRVGGLLISEDKTNIDFDVVKFLSKTGDLTEIAANLFAHLHELEEMDLDIILVEPIKKEGLGVAIMDRLTKATNRYL